MCDSFGASPSGSADPVDVVFDAVGHIVIDDISDIVDVKASACNICCNKNCASATVFEVLEQLFTNCLIFVTMDTLHTFDAFLVKLLNQVVYSFLCLTENECTRLTAICL